jgi:hypothetical protein
MKHVLSASTSISPLPTPSPHVTKTMPSERVLPQALDPVYQCPQLGLDNECACAHAACTNTFPTRYGVCFESWWRVDGRYEYGGCIFCSLTCLLGSAVMLGTDGAVREFRDETQTLH